MTTASHSAWISGQGHVLSTSSSPYFSALLVPPEWEPDTGLLCASVFSSVKQSNSGANPPQGCSGLRN